MLCPAHKAFHESRRFVNQFHHFFFLRHFSNVTTLRVINSWKGSRVWIMLTMGRELLNTRYFFGNNGHLANIVALFPSHTAVLNSPKNKGSFREVTFRVRS